MPIHAIFVQGTHLSYLLGSCFRVGGPVGLLSGAGAEGCFFHRVNYRPTRWTRHSCSGQRVTLCCPGSAPWACKIALLLVGEWGDCKNQTGLCSRKGGKEIAFRVDGVLERLWHARVRWTLHTTCSKCHACRLPLYPIRTPFSLPPYQNNGLYRRHSRHRLHVMRRPALGQRDA